MKISEVLRSILQFYTKMFFFLSLVLGGAYLQRYWTNSDPKFPLLFVLMGLLLCGALGYLTEES